MDHHYLSDFGHEKSAYRHLQTVGSLLAVLWAVGRDAHPDEESRMEIVQITNGLNIFRHLDSCLAGIELGARAMTGGYGFIGGDVVNAL